MKDVTIISVSEPTEVAAARRAAAETGRRLGLSDDTVARAELAAVELASNLLHHASRGVLYLAPLTSGQGMHVIAVDQGPGMGDLERAMQDGFSTGNTPGIGLGAVKRIVSSLDVYSRSDLGTVAVATLREAPSRSGASHVSDSAADPELRLSERLASEEFLRRQDESTAVLSTRIAGETVNGDTWELYEAAGRVLYLVVDGLGHGAYASQAARIAVDVATGNLRANPEMSLATLIERMHQPMHASRGAAVMLVSVCGEDVRACGVGNISATLALADGSLRNLVSHNGTVGHRMARVQEFRYAAPSGTLLLMNSDGISTRWRLSNYPGLREHKPATIAAVLYRDAVRGRDDATILVSRLDEPRPADGGEELRG